ncbi:hypothetical protein QBC38DRAFT_483719, partial [Podospora fimiseda]
VSLFGPGWVIIFRIIFSLIHFILIVITWPINDFAHVAIQILCAFVSPCFNILTLLVFAFRGLPAQLRRVHLWDIFLSTYILTSLSARANHAQAWCCRLTVGFVKN